MAMLEARGYAKFVKSKDSNGGSFKSYSLGVKQKGRNGQPDTYANYAITDFTDDGKAVEENSFVQVKGYITVREYEHNGAKRTSLDVKATEVEVNPGREPSGATATKGTAPEKDPWE